MENPKDNWSYSEIIHALMIFIFFNELSDFCNATGLNVEISD
jgi:hypothetical protein